MVYIVVQSNISAIQAWVTFACVGVLFCVEGFGSALNAAIARKIPFDRFRNDECSWSFWSAWIGSCFLFSLLGSLFVWDMYTVSYQSDSAPIIFGALVFYLLSMRAWIWAYYTMRWGPIASYIFCALALVSSFFVIGFAFLAIDDHPWHHYFSIVSIVPPIAAMYAIYHCERSFRSPISQSMTVTTTTTTVQPAASRANSLVINNTNISRQQKTNDNNYRPAVFDPVQLSAQKNLSGVFNF